MNRTRRRLTIKRETVRRLASGELQQVAGGLITVCTYERSGCRGAPTGDCVSSRCDWTEACGGWGQ